MQESSSPPCLRTRVSQHPPHIYLLQLPGVLQKLRKIENIDLLYCCWYKVQTELTRLQLQRQFQLWEDTLKVELINMSSGRSKSPFTDGAAVNKSRTSYNGEILSTFFSPFRFEFLFGGPPSFSIVNHCQQIFSRLSKTFGPDSSVAKTNSNKSGILIPKNYLPAFLLLLS